MASKTVVDLRRAVRESLSDVAPQSLVIVACSGGPDSLALAAVTAMEARKQGWKTCAVIVDHGWHEDSLAVAQAASAECLRLGIDATKIVSVVCEGVGGPEAVARTARYEALDTAASESGAVAVLLGHTLDDQAETVFLGLVRGSGARSLSGMAARRGVYRRPFLGIKREAVEAVCSELDLRVWRDPANKEDAYTRVRVREALKVLEASLGKDLIDALGRSADLLREDADELDRQASALLAYASREALGELILDVSYLEREGPAVRKRAIQKALKMAGCPPESLGSKHIEAVDRLVMAYNGQGALQMPGKVSATRKKSEIILGATNV